MRLSRILNGRRGRRTVESGLSSAARVSEVSSDENVHFGDALGDQSGDVRVANDREVADFAFQILVDDPVSETREDLQGRNRIDTRKLIK